MSKKPLVEELASTDFAQAQAVEAEADRADGDSIKGGGGRNFLEVGVTSRPVGHSLNCQEGYVKPFTAPVPPSQLLAKLDAFLPQIAAANEKIKEELERSPETAQKFDVNHCEDDEENVVEMNLAVVPLDDENDGQVKEAGGN
mmetsp:Transcript_1095/g.1270  ORF Transcript_1095/g.1270 Transcript_1095/m.1270 type:complete len:143 (+) Transcript_1095:169-597(+)|eukprot:CAMPEP_0203756036 /NCGR_PEP_ID=MMETSP0098-20131031/9358_1 /ASSEMBLY_ACC=CAM_ASM_000208 /TAXON_ID=96639 /ORGANISM=" , Strain NY0313808BC1" /LENGTH=142 /DNA_ID=CAMNT_0050647717 /DNA_START=55 /DNA_END=483 /DNA_ORIENTATION=-